MSTSSQKSDKDELVESDLVGYGSTTDEEIPTKPLEEIYKIIGNWLSSIQVSRQQDYCTKSN